MVLLLPTSSSWPLASMLHLIAEPNLEPKTPSCSDPLSIVLGCRTQPKTQNTHHNVLEILSSMLHRWWVCDVAFNCLAFLLLLFLLKMPTSSLHNFCGYAIDISPNCVARKRLITLLNTFHTLCALDPFILLSV